MDWRQHITVDPAVCHGKACIKGTRVDEARPPAAQGVVAVLSLLHVLRATPSKRAIAGCDSFRDMLHEKLAT